MKQMLEKLKRAGWRVGTCNWQIFREHEQQTLECYTIRMNGEVKTIIIQQFSDGSCTLFSNTPELCY